MQIAQQERTILSNLRPEDQSEFDLPTDGTAKKIIQDILIRKQYANPLKAACREALQNALDANKEARNQHLPITITLPTEDEPLLIFEDCGVGIGAERFDKVYKRWGESTKREDNTQMGGFGVGRFSALAIAPQVAITSVCDSIKYSHVLYRNEKGNCAAATLDTQPTNEPNGTKLSIPIQEEDIFKVIDYIRELTMWVQQPIVFKQGYGYFQDTKAWKFTGVAKKLQGDIDLPWYFNNAGTSYLKVTVLIGDLPYLITGQKVKGLLTKFDLEVTANSKIFSSLIIRIPVGSVELTSNRENIEDTDKNLNKLKALVWSVITDVETKLSELVTLPSLRSCLKAFYSDYPFSNFERQGVSLTKCSFFASSAKNIWLTTDLFSSCFLTWGAFYDSIYSQITKEFWANLPQGDSPTIHGSNHSLKHLLDCAWVVYPKGMSKDKVRKLANVESNKHILAIRAEEEPEDYVKRHRLLSLMDDVITVNFEKKKTSSLTPKKASLKSLVKSGGARTLSLTDESIHNIYEATEKVEDLPDSGVYIKTEEAKYTFQRCHLPPSLSKKDLFFVSNTIAEELRKDSNWINFRDYCSTEFDRLTDYYKLGLELINYTIDQDWFNKTFLFGDKRASSALAEILLASSIKREDILVLIELLNKPDEGNWLADISCSRFLIINSHPAEGFCLLEQKEVFEPLSERTEKRERLQNLSWRLEGTADHTNNYFQGYQWTNIPIFKKLVEKYPLLTYILRYYTFNKSRYSAELPKEQQALLPEIIKYIKNCDA
jgi:hypothetical protein